MAQQPLFRGRAWEAPDSILPKQLHSDKPYVPPGGTKEIAKLLHNLVGVKKSREKASGASSVKK